MKRHILVAGIFLALATCIAMPSQAQYVTGIGLRGGKFNSGISFKRFVNANNNVGVEAMIGRSKIGTDDGWVAKTFFLYQRPIMDARMQAPFDLVFGAGLHGAFYKTGYYYLESGHIMPYGYNVYVFGVDAMFGIEYKVPIAPLTITVDCNPFLDLVNKGPEFIDFGLSLRWVMR